MADPPRRAVLAFDNSGTLSRTTVVEDQVVPGERWARPVPELDDGTAVALVSIDQDHLGAFATDRSVGPVVSSGDVPLYVSLSTVECTAERVREALVADTETPARSLVACVEAAVERTDGDPGSVGEGGIETAAAGTQLVVDLDGGRVVRVIGYTATPLAAAREVVDWASSAGFEPHIVSGDTAHVLRRVASEVGIDGRNVHAYQTPAGKGTTIDSLREKAGLPAVMVGDHVNDRFAFEAADVAVFVDDRGYETARSMLDPVADVTVTNLSALPGVLDGKVASDPGDD